MDLKVYEPNFLWDEPCEYKGVDIYPVLMKEYYQFYTSIGCINIPKNRSKDIKIIKMNYLDFLFYLAEEDETQSIYLTLLFILLNLVFKNQSARLIQFDDSNFGIGITKGNNEEVTISGFEFDEFVSIVIKQNNITLPEVELNEELETELERARKIKENIEGKNESAELEEVVLSFMIYSGLQIDQIKTMSIRKFNRSIERMTLLEDYRVYKTAEVSGTVEFKQSIPHWLSKFETGDVDSDLKIAPESLQTRLKDVANFTKEMKLDGTE